MQFPHVKSFQNLFYKTNITIGTPPQTFNVALDTLANDIFVPSVDCPPPCFYGRNRTYDSSQSSTYLEHGGHVSSNWAGVSYDGLLSYDTLHLGGANITTYLFEEWTSASCVSIGCLQFGYDGVLGLATPWDWYGKTRPNILTTLLSQKTLDKPIFSLKLPIGLKDEGEILFGARNPELNSSAFIDLPYVNVSRPPFSSPWAVPASHISFGSPHPLNYTLPANGYAVLASAHPYLILPFELARNLTAALGARPGPAWFHNIPCERRQELPLLTFTLDGHEFSISAFDYTLEIDMPQFGRNCITTFMAATDFGFPHNWEGIMLGHPFLRGFYSAWDFESGNVGRKPFCPLLLERY